MTIQNHRRRLIPSEFYSADDGTLPVAQTDDGDQTRLKPTFFTS
jgi:hypothetical protein